MRNIGRFGFEKFSMREHDAELIIQLMKQRSELRIGSEILHARAARGMLLRRLPGRDRVRDVRTVPVRAGWPVRIAPQ